MNEMNMVPFIDVMLVLLIIFMVTAPMVTTGMIKPPSVGRADAPPALIAKVLVDKDGAVQWELPSSKPEAVQLSNVGQVALQWQEEQESAGRTDDQYAIVIVGDGAAAYESVTNAMKAMKDAGVRKVAFLFSDG